MEVRPSALAVVVAFRGGRAGSDVRPVEYLPAEAFHPVQGGGFNGGFAEGGMVLQGLFIFSK